MRFLISVLVFSSTFIIVNMVSAQSNTSDNLRRLMTQVEFRLEEKQAPKPKGQGFLLRFYKKFISTQDGNSCAFYPSCSVYAYRVIKRKGLLIGLMATADRLCRCNPWEKDGYYVHKAYLRYSDFE